MSRRLIVLAVLLLAAISTGLLRGAGSEAADMPVTAPPELRPLAGERRLVVLLADNSGTETTDLLVPHGILQRSGAVDVLIVATGEGAVELMPALTIMPDMTVAQFERAYPDGADAVIVPAFHSRGSAATTAFIRSQAALGAFIVSICEGSEPVARAGLFDGRAATTHWHAHPRMKRRYPRAAWVQNTRYVTDGPVMSSSGVSASVPVTLKLLDLLEGPEIARATAARIGIEDWSATHDSTRFRLTVRMIALAASNRLRFWQHDALYADVADGFDGIAFALQADAWSRTYRSRLAAHNLNGRAISAESVIFITQTGRQTVKVLPASSGAPFAVLDANLEAIAERYGPRTADFVATQLEYVWP